MHAHDVLHGLLVGKANVVEEAASEERVGQLFLVVAGDENDGALLGDDLLSGLVNVKLHAVELEQQIIRELDIRLVDLVDEQHRLHIALEGFPELPFDDVVGDVVHARLAELRVAQSRHGVVLVESLLRLAGGFDVPGNEGPAERCGHLLGEARLAGARLSLDQ